MELLDCMKKENKSWAFYVFSSANAIRKYTMEELVQLGVSWVWMGLESPKSTYSKLKGTDTVKLARSCAATASSCSARPSSAWSTTRRRTSARRSSTPSRTKPTSTSSCCTRRCRERRFTNEMEEQGRMLDRRRTWPTFTGNTNSTSSTRPSPATIPRSFWIGLSGAISSATAPAFTASARPPCRAGSVTRTHPDLRVRERFEWEARSLKSAYAACLWAMERRFKETNESVSEQMHTLRRDIESEFGVFSTHGLVAPRTGAAMDLQARGEAPGRRANLRAAHRHRAPQLGGGLRARPRAAQRVIYRSGQRNHLCRNL